MEVYSVNLSSSTYTTTDTCREIGFPWGGSCLCHSLCTSQILYLGVSDGCSEILFLYFLQYWNAPKKGKQWLIVYHFGGIALCYFCRIFSLNVRLVLSIAQMTQPFLFQIMILYKTLLIFKENLGSSRCGSNEMLL